MEAGQTAEVKKTRAPEAKTRAIGTLEGAGLVALGAMVGAGIRAGIGLLPLPKDAVPVGTLIVNLAGAFLLGLLYAVLDARELAAEHAHDSSGSHRRMVLRLLLGTGVMGGLTTYSTFLLEVVTRLGQERVGLALAYGIGSVLAGWLMVILGDWLGRACCRPGGQSNTHTGSGTDAVVDAENETVIDEADSQAGVGVQEDAQDAAADRQEGGRR